MHPVFSIFLMPELRVRTGPRLKPYRSVAQISGVLPTHVLALEKTGGKKERIVPANRFVIREPQGSIKLQWKAMETILARLADSTLRVHAFGWHQGSLYTFGTRIYLFPGGEHRCARNEDEQRLTRFLLFPDQVPGDSP